MAKRSSDLTRTGESTDIEKNDNSDVLDVAAANSASSSANYGGDDTLELASAETDDDDTDQIKAQIEETRANMGETIDAIQERLSFANISEQVSEQVNQAIETAKDSAYKATIGKAVNFMKTTGNELSRSSIVKTAQDNPLPLLLIGLGAGLLAYKSFGARNNRNRSMSQYRSAQFRDRQYRPGEENASSSMMQTAQEGIGSVKDSVSNAAGTVKDTVSTAAGSAYDAVSRAAESTVSGAGEFANRAYEKVGGLGSKAQETYTHYMEEKPWAIGAVALVAGAAIGLAIPSSRYEGELMGEARLNLLNKATDTASEFVDRAKQAATDAGSTVVEEVKKADLI